MDDLFNEQSKNIRIYPATEVANDKDPFEGNSTVSYLNPIPIKAIVTDLTATQVGYKMPGILTDKAKELIIKKKYETLLTSSYKIEIDGDTTYYEGWKQNGKCQFRIEGNYLRVYIYAKQV